jgi:hypothetical protein
MAKGPGVSVTSHFIATSQNNIHYYIEKMRSLQAKVFIIYYLIRATLHGPYNMKEHVFA